MNTPHGTRNLVPEDRATILAALRMYQEACLHGTRNAVIIEIATDNGTISELNIQDIDGLCEEISRGRIVRIGE